MKDFVKRMLAEHQELVERIATLDDYIYSDKSDKDDKVEFANKCIQLTAMKKYEEALRARLENNGVNWYNGEYFEHLDKQDIKCEAKSSSTENAKSDAV